MATYKVIQDIEAEDKLLGPLSLRQFIYAVIVVALGFLMFTFGKVGPLFALPFLPPAILFGFLAAPFGHDQSSEVWLLAKFHYLLKPRVRVWNQAGLQELVTVTAPKKAEQILTNGLDQYQVQSRLQALARTIDTRGWAVKGVDSVAMLPSPLTQVADSDRLVAVDSITTVVADYDPATENDILDTDTSPVAQQVDQLIQASTTAHRQALMAKMTQPASTTPSAATPAVASAPTASSVASPPTPPAVPMYTTPALGNLPPAPSVAPAVTVTQTPDPVPAPVPVSGAPTADEAALLEQVHEQQARHDDALKRMYALKQVPATPPAPQPEPSPVTQTPDPGILKLANNDDLTVATIARQAHKHDPPANDEVVISLH